MCTLSLFKATYSYWVEIHDTWFLVLDLPFGWVVLKILLRGMLQDCWHVQWSSSWCQIILISHLRCEKVVDIFIHSPWWYCSIILQMSLNLWCDFFEKSLKLLETFVINEGHVLRHEFSKVMDPRSCKGGMYVPTLDLYY